MPVLLTSTFFSITSIRMHYKLLPGLRALVEINGSERSLAIFTQNLVSPSVILQRRTSFARILYSDIVSNNLSLIEREHCSRKIHHDPPTFLDADFILSINRGTEV